MSVSVTADLFDELERYFDELPQVTTEAARLAINDTARGPAISLSREEMYDQVNFPAGYLGSDRLFVAKFAKNNDLEAVVTGRDRPTSLARFATNPTPGQRGVTVQVHKGHSKMMKKAFIVKLRAGRTMDGQTFNVGLAIRLAPGEKLINKTLPAEVYATSLGPNVVLLYGPSVDQVFRSVSTEVAPAVADHAVSEFYRQFARLSNG
ncbi:hypothetical protein [Pseudomonas citronellolis]|uniref:hypothetical protein n=1 Tax=Pseudomonas citronellolis TaxID=53408 RepID=UPI00248E9F35|nr:hypothetical protein [Pseudomonas citronellolis]